MAVHAKGIEKSGAPHLGPQQRGVHLQEPSLTVLSMQVQLTCANSMGPQAPVAHAPAVCLGQEAVHKVELRLLESVN